MKIPVLRLCFLLAAVSVNFPLMPAAHGEGEPPPFEARFESDAEGTWFVYPTVRGCHYRIESSSTTNPADFVVEPGTFHYGSGSERRWWIAAPPPPAVPPLNPPPPRTFTGLTIQIEVANDQPGPVVDVYRLHPQHPWSARLNLELPLRNLNYPVPFISIGNTPTEHWSLSGTTRFLHLEDFTGVAPPPDFDSNSPEGREYAFLIAHWDELVSNLTPPEAYIPESPNVPPVSTAPPDFSQRRFLRVQRVGVDTNGNSFPDWYEWKYGYNPFATGPAQGGFLQAGLDDDGDGLSAEEEFAAGTSPVSRDTDEDYASDGEEVHPPGGKAATNPLDITSVNLALMSMGAMAGGELAFYRHTSEGETAPHWRHWLGLYVENPQAVIGSYGSLMHAVAAGGYPATPEETFGHPDYGQMHTLLGSAAGFSGLHGAIISRPAPLWWLHRPPPGGEGVGTSSTAYPDYEGSLQLTAARSYVRVRAPEDADLLVPVEIRTYAHWSSPDIGPLTPETTEIKYLHVPAGGNVSDDAVDITSTFEVPDFFDYNPYLPPPATIRGNHTEARLKFVTTGTSLSVPVIEVSIDVDNDRDGEITNQKADDTSKAKPYQFWLNNDDDAYSPRTYNANHDHPWTDAGIDSTNNQIESERDLDDFGLIHLSVSQAWHDSLANGEIFVHLTWKPAVTTLNLPSIRVFPCKEFKGTKSYLSDLTEAILLPGTQAYGVVSQTSQCVVPSAFWNERKDVYGGKFALLFEGISEGTGELQMQFVDEHGALVGQGGSCWLKLADIRKMYERFKVSDTAVIPDPSAIVSDGSNSVLPPVSGITVVPDPFDFPFVPAWDEDLDDKSYVICLHGWRKSYYKARSDEITIYKRLWHRGFKGRFIGFNWPTYDYDSDNVAVASLLSKYNESEYRAWKCGVSLKALVDELPTNYRKNIIAHSLGSVVVTSALHSGMSASNIIMLNAAVPASCYDSDISLEQSPALAWMELIPYTAWDGADLSNDPLPAFSSLGYRGVVATGGAFRVVNFFLPADLATSSVWTANHWSGLFGSKPRPGYSYSPGVHLRYQLGLLDRPVIDRHEAMSMLNRSLTKSLGAEGRTAGAISDKVDMGAVNIGFGSEHEAIFKWSSCDTWLCYRFLMSQMRYNFTK